MRPFSSLFPLFFLSLQRVFDARLNSLQQRSVFFPCVCLCNGWEWHVWAELGYKWQLSTTVFFFLFLFFISTANVNLRRGINSRYVSPFFILWGVLLTSSARVRIEDCIHSMYSSFSFNPCLGPLRLFLHSNSSPYLQDESPQQTEVQCSIMFRFYTMALLIKCMPSINKYHSNME